MIALPSVAGRWPSLLPRPAAARRRRRGPRLDVKAVVAKVQKRYDEAADFRARFTQTLTSAAMRRKTSSSGEVTVQEAGAHALGLREAGQASYVTDGGVLWLYEPDDKQAFKQDLKASQLPAALAFLTGKGKLAAEFDITFGRKTPRRHRPATTCCRCRRRRRRRR